MRAMRLVHDEWNNACSVRRNGVSEVHTCLRRDVYMREIKNYALTMSGIMPVPYVEMALLRYAHVSEETYGCGKKSCVHDEWNNACSVRRTGVSEVRTRVKRDKNV